MIEKGIEFIQTIIQAHGAWGVFLATIVEEVIAPIPSSLVPLVGGFSLLAPEAGAGGALLHGTLLVALPVAAGVALGSSAVYAVAYYGGKPLIERSQRFLGLKWKGIEQMNERFQKGRSDELTLFALRLVPIIPGVALSGFCGTVQYPFTRFLLITLLGSFVRALALAFLGWKAGEYYVQYLDVIDRVEGYVLVSVIALVLAWVSIHYLRKRRAQERA